MRDVLALILVLIFILLSGDISNAGPPSTQTKTCRCGCGNNGILHPNSPFGGLYDCTQDSACYSNPGGPPQKGCIDTCRDYGFSEVFYGSCRK